MRRAALLAITLLASCAHPEDRRWASLGQAPARPADEFRPQVGVYSFATEAELKPATRLRDLSGEGQAAYIDRMGDSQDPAGLRQRLSTPISGPGGLGASQQPTLERTVVVAVSKARASGIGDRLMRTVVTIEPADDSFEFTGYTVAATDNQVQSIAHLETTSGASLEASLAPTIKGTGDNGVAAKLSRSQTTAADIVQQFEKLTVDIQPSRIVITRESERGLDVVGNTILKLSIRPKPPAGMLAAGAVFLVNDQKLFSKGTALLPAAASLELAATYLPLKCAIKTLVSMDFRLRHVLNGSEYYTEGKQRVVVVNGYVGQTRYELVRAEETQPSLWQIVTTGGFGIVASQVDGSSHPLVFSNYDAAQAFSFWLGKTRSRTLGTDGLLLMANGRVVGAQPEVREYSFACPAAPATQTP